MTMGLTHFTAMRYAVVGWPEEWNQRQIHGRDPPAFHNDLLTALEMNIFRTPPETKESIIANPSWRVDNMLRKLFPTEFPLNGSANPPIPSQVFRMRHMDADPVLFQRDVVRLANARGMNLYNVGLATEDEFNTLTRSDEPWDNE